MSTTNAVTATAEPHVRYLAPDVEIVVPVYNEEEDLARSVTRLQGYLKGTFPFTWVVTIVDNASTDSTWDVACHLARRLPGVRALRLDKKGRGRALRAAWLQSSATVVAYMDVDLSTDLRALLPLVAPLLSGHSDVAIGSRLAPGSRVVRGLKREVISRSYNALLRASLRNRFSDAQCGFKALRADVAHWLVRQVKDNEWFFDTELLVLAERHGLRVHEVPVDWVDDPDSRVNIMRTAKEDLKGVVRLLRSTGTGAARPVANQSAEANMVKTTARALASATSLVGWPLYGAARLYRVLRAPWSAAAAHRDGGRGPAVKALVAKLCRYATVSAISTTTTLAILGGLVYTKSISAGWANVVATAVGTVPSFELNRRWVWSKRGQRSVGREVLPFLALSFSGLGLSTLAVSAVARLAAAGGAGRGAVALASEAANFLTFGALWVVQYVLLDRALFKQPVARAGLRPEPTRAGTGQAKAA